MTGDKAFKALLLGAASAKVVAGERSCLLSAGRILANLGASLNKNSSKFTPGHWACLRGPFEKIRRGSQEICCGIVSWPAAFSLTTGGRLAASIWAVLGIL